MVGVSKLPSLGEFWRAISKEVAPLITFHSGTGGVGLEVKDARESLLAKGNIGLFAFFVCLEHK